jgi:hypothetical protein
VHLREGERRAAVRKEHALPVAVGSLPATVGGLLVEAEVHVTQLAKVVESEADVCLDLPQFLFRHQRIVPAM